MARLALFLLGLAAPAAAAEPVTAEAALERYRALIEPVAVPKCPKASTSDEIIVCGNRGARDPNRLPPPAEGQRIRGEAMSAVAAMGAREKCSTVGPNQNCGGGLPIMAIAMTAAKVAIKLIKGDD